MARAKYKIGTLVEAHTGADGEVKYGVVTGVVTKADGYRYEIDDNGTAMAEEAIANGYRPIAQRKAAATKKATSGKSRSPKKHKAEAEEAMQ